MTREESVETAHAFLSLLFELLDRHGCHYSELTDCLKWLDQRLTDYAATRDEPLAQYTPIRLEARGEGAFRSRLREQQAKNAQAAMRGLGMRLQDAYDEIERLRQQLAKSERFAEALTDAASPLLAAIPDPSAFGVYLRMQGDEVREWCRKARQNPELGEEIAANEAAAKERLTKEFGNAEEQSPG